MIAPVGYYLIANGLYPLIKTRPALCGFLSCADLVIVQLVFFPDSNG